MLRVDPTFAKKGDYAAFQAADLLAFEYLLSNRAILAAPEKLTFSELRKSLQALFARQPESASTQWGVHDKTVIEKAWLAMRE